MDPSPSVAMMDSQNTLEDTNLEIPNWVMPVLNKYKAEICAEITARVAYSVRIMLDKNLEEMKEFLAESKGDAETSSYEEQVENLEGFCCKCVKKGLKKQERKAKKEERKEEKKLKKAEKSLAKLKNFPLASNDLLSVEKVSETASFVEIGTGLTEETSSHETVEAEVLANMNSFEEKTSSIGFKLELPEMIPTTEDDEAETEKKALSSCESEFEVIPMPNPPHAFHFVDATHLDSLGGSSEDEGTTSDAEESLQAKTNELINSTEEAACDLLNSASSGSTLMNASSESVVPVTAENIEEKSISLENSVVLETSEGNGLQLERTRNPYCATVGEITVVNMMEDVDEDPPQQTNDYLPEQRTPPPAPAPSLGRGRGRAAYSTNQERRHAQERPRGARYHGDGRQHVDILPENLWKGAVSVAAQAYNAAKSVVGDLSGVVIPQPQQHYTRPAPPTNPPCPQQNRSPLEQLADMGFTNTDLNIELLARFNNNMEDVIAALLEF